MCSWASGRSIPERAKALRHPAVLDARECDAFIERSEQLGYFDAPINTSFGPLLRKDVRDNQRILVDDPELATAWWDRAKGLIVEEWLGWEAVGFNERFRLYRYDPGQRFAPHMDDCFQRDNGEQISSRIALKRLLLVQGSRHTEGSRIWFAGPVC